MLAPEVDGSYERWEAEVRVYDRAVEIDSYIIEIYIHCIALLW